MAFDELEHEALLQEMLTYPPPPIQRPKRAYELVEQINRQLNNQQVTKPASTLHLASIFNTFATEIASANFSLSDTALVRVHLLPYIRQVLSSQQETAAETAWQAILRLVFLPYRHNSNHVLIPSQVEAADRTLDDQCIDVILALLRQDILDAPHIAWQAARARIKAEASTRRAHAVTSYLPRTQQFLDARSYRRVIRRKVAIALSSSPLPVELRDMVADQPRLDIQSRRHARRHGRALAVVSCTLVSVRADARADGPCHADQRRGPRGVYMLKRGESALGLSAAALACDAW